MSLEAFCILLLSTWAAGKEESAVLPGTGFPAGFIKQAGSGCLPVTVMNYAHWKKRLGDRMLRSKAWMLDGLKLSTIGRSLKKNFDPSAASASTPSMLIYFYL